MARKKKVQLLNPQENIPEKIWGEIWKKRRQETIRKVE